MKAEKWEKKQFEGVELGGKTLGLIGIGNIGKEVARRANALGMTVIAYDPYVKSAEGVKLVELDELLQQADYISLHLPKTKESAGMLGADAFAKMKTGVRIINCARGGIIDETALYEALKQRQGGRRGPGCLCRRAADGLETGQAPECDRLTAHRRCHQRSAGARRRGSGGEADRIRQEACSPPDPGGRLSGGRPSPCTGDRRPLPRGMTV